MRGQALVSSDKLEQEEFVKKEKEKKEALSGGWGILL